MAEVTVNDPRFKLGTIADVFNHFDPAILKAWDGWHYSTACTSQIDGEDAYVRLTLAWKCPEGQKARFCDGIQVSKIENYYIPLVNTTGKPLIYTEDQYNALYEDTTGTAKVKHVRW